MRVRLAFTVGALCLTGGCGELPPNVTERGSEPMPEAAMKISLERSGGFAGMTRTFQVDADALTDEERALVDRLVASAEFFALPATIAAPDAAGADRFSYRLTIESADGTHTVETSDASAPDSLKPLIDWVSERGRGD